MRVKIKPLSINAAWAGRRFKTPVYQVYEQELLLRLPKTYHIPEGKLRLVIIFGFSSKASDLDNGLKPFIDILQKKYQFNDKRIYAIVCRKEDVKKGSEFVDFEIDHI